MEFLKDIFKLMRERKKWWLLPIMLALLAIGWLIILGGSSAVSPFIYAIF